MGLEQLGNLGEFVGAIAVLGSVVYLAIQIRQNTAAVRGSTFQASIDGWQAFMLYLSQPEQVSLGQATEVAGEPTDEQIIRLWWIARMSFRRFENDFYQYNSGVFDQSAFEGYRKSLANDVLSDPGMRAMWRIQRVNFGDAFTAFMNAEVDAARGQQPRPWADQWRRAMREEPAA